MSHVYLYVRQNLLDELRTRLGDHFADDDDEGGRVLMGTPALYTNGTVTMAVFCHPVSDAVMARMEARRLALPLAIRTLVGVVKTIPAGWTLIAP